MPLADMLGPNGEIPQGSVAVSKTTTTALPDWYTNGAMDIFAQQKAIANQPYQPYDQAPRIAGFTPDQIGSFAATRGAAGAYQPGLDQSNAWLNQAAGMPTGSSAAQPGINHAVDAAGNAIAGGGGLAAAMPWLQGASGDVTNVDAYMDPYRKNVTDYMTEISNRNLFDTVLPGVESRYIRSGQFGGSGKMTDTMRAIRDMNVDLLGKTGEYLSSGYKTSQEMKGSDLDRLGTLGATAGTLGTAGQRAELDAATLYGEAGKTMGEFAGTDADRMAANAAQAAGNAGLAQQYGLTGANALNTMGGQQQQFNQSNLDLAYKDWQAERDYPQQQLDKTLATYGALGKGVPTSTTAEGIEPGNFQQQYPPSTAEQVGGTLTGIGSFFSSPAGMALLKSWGVNIPAT